MSKIRFNEDWFHFFHSRYSGNIRVDKQYLKDFIYQYRDTQITDFSMNVNARVSSFPSRVLQSFSDKYLIKEENGRPVDYTRSFAALAYDIFVRQGLDMYKIWIEALREIGIRPWISVRMNDCHANISETNILLSDFYHAHPEIRRVKHRIPDPSLKRVADDAMYFEDCYDYGLDVVRDQMFAYIEEVFGRYDMDGLELDFTRELPSFAIGAEARGREIMTAFLGKIKTLADMYSEKRGRAIEISVLVNSCPVRNYEWGLDVVEWARRGYVNSVIALPRWQSTDTNIPVKLWKDLLSQYGVEFAAGNQILISDDPREYGYTGTLETDLGAIAVYRSAGADFTYIYNHMDMFYSGYPQTKRWINDDDLCEKVLHPDKLKKLFTTAGDKELTIHSRRRHLASFHDFPLYYEKQTSPLPLACDDSRIYRFVKINIGDVPDGARMHIIIGTKSENELEPVDLNIRVNNKPVAYCEVSALSETCFGWMFEIDNDGTLQKSAVAEISTTGKAFDVVHAEIMVTPQ